MTRLFIGLLLVAISFTPIAAIAVADDATDQAIKKDRQHIAGTWRVVALEVNGKKLTEAETKELTVVNSADGTWRLLQNGKEIVKGTSTLDPSRTPKTIDFTPTKGGDEGKEHLGIYKLGQNRRIMCFAPAGLARPTDFSSRQGSQHILVTFERQKAK